ncbi:MAG: hypothetical protein JNM43_01240 [Planctomycetaceae bacterium]|nr:hypothetical protein [Planctomycetaceae bacterium]
MNTKHLNMTRLPKLVCGLLCMLAGVVCFAKGYSSPSNSTANVSGERQGVSPPSASSALMNAYAEPQFTSLTPRYVTKRIADLEVGEEVVAKDPESGEVTTKRVANVFRKVSDHLRILQVRNPQTNELQTIETTDDHPFWVAAIGQWIDAKDLKLGDRLDDVDGGTAILESTSRELHPEGIPVFNFEVEDFHTYFVRAHGSRGPPVLTHNTDCGEFLTVVDASPPGINGLPGTGVFGDGIGNVTLYHWPEADGTGHIAIGAGDSYLSISPSRKYGEQLNELTGSMPSQTGIPIRFDNRTSPALLHSLADDITKYGAPRILHVPGSDSIAAQMQIASVFQNPLYRLHGNLGSGQCAINCLTTAVDVLGAANPKLRNLAMLKSEHAYPRQLEEWLQNRLDQLRTGNP